MSLRLVNETIEEAFEKYNVIKEKRFHTCYNCKKKYQYHSVEYIHGYVVFKGRPHECPSKFWGSKAIPISKKEKEFWTEVL